MSGDDLRAEMGKFILQQGMSEYVEELSKRILLDAKAIELADELARTSHEYIVALVHHGPYDVGLEARAHIEALKRYREHRGIG